MAQKFIEYSPPPVRTPLLRSTGLLEVDWEKWFHRLQWFIKKRPSCHVYSAADQTITTSTEKDLAFDTQDHDNANMHDTSTNSDRITLPSDGIYQAGAHVFWEANAVGFRGLRISLNDAAPAAAGAILGSENPLAASFSSNSPAYGLVLPPTNFSAGDILRVNVLQDSGGDLDVIGTTTGGGPFSSAFWCFKVSDPPAVAG